MTILTICPTVMYCTSLQTRASHLFPLPPFQTHQFNLLESSLNHPPLIPFLRGAVNALAPLPSTTPQVEPSPCCLQPQPQCTYLSSTLSYPLWSSVTPWLPRSRPSLESLHSTALLSTSLDREGSSSELMLCRGIEHEPHIWCARMQR